MKNSGWWKGLLKYALGFGLLAFVVSQNWADKPLPPDAAPGTTPQPGLKTLFERGPDFTPLALIAVILVGCTAIQFYRWYLLVRALDLPFTLRNAVRLGAVGVFYNTFLPGSVGGDFVKAFFIARGQPGRRAAAVATVVADRLVGLFGLILYVAVVGGGCWLAGDQRIDTNPYLRKIVQVCFGLVAGTVVGWVVLGFLSAPRADRFREMLAKLPAGNTFSELWYTVWTYRQRPRTVAAVVAMSAVVHTGFVLNFHLAVQVFPPTNPDQIATLPEHFVVAPIGYIAQALFPAPGGVGGAEAIFGYLYELIRGKDAVVVGVAGRLALRLVEWSLGFVCYIAYLRMKDELPGVEAEPGAAGPDDPENPSVRSRRSTVLPTTLPS